jgi:hypothetical protein
LIPEVVNETSLPVATNGGVQFNGAIEVGNRVGVASLAAMLLPTMVESESTIGLAGFLALDDARAGSEPRFSVLEAAAVVNLDALRPGVLGKDRNRKKRSKARAHDGSSKLSLGSVRQS